MSQLGLFDATARKPLPLPPAFADAQAPAPPSCDAETPEGPMMPRWAVCVATPEGAPGIAPVPVQAPTRIQAEQIAAAFTGIDEDRCLAVEHGGWYEELMSALDGANERAEAELQRLRRIHAKILGCSIEELDARVAEEKRQEQDTKAQRRAERPTRGRTHAPSPRAAHPSLHEEPAAAPTRRLDDRQRELLALVAVEGNRAVYTRDERVPDWGAIKVVVENLGGRWKTGGKKRRGGWDFPQDVDAAEMIRLAQASGEILDLRAAGFFETPVALADELVRIACIPPGLVVLEPSAGSGRIATAVRRRHPNAHVLCCELLPKNREELWRLGFEVVGQDFLAVAPSDLPPVDAVCANPPFAKFADAAHVMHALRFLRPGGRLAAIMSAGARYRDAAPYREFRAALQANGGTMEDCPEDAFIESGTGVRTVMVTLTKVGPT